MRCPSWVIYVGFMTLTAFFFPTILLGKEPSDAVPGKRTVTYQNGINGYIGCIDAEIWAVAPDTIIETNPNVSTDANNDGGESQILMRFDGIIGDKGGQISPKSTIHSAKLIISAFDQGTTVNLHRMLVNWPRKATWRSMVGGVTADGLEASRTRDGFTFGKIAANASDIPFDVTDTVQAWANGKKNYGWVFINTGGNGWDFYSSDFEQVKQRPKLVIEYTPPTHK